METLTTRKCVNCDAEHKEPSHYCSQLCFDEYYAKVQAQTLKYVLDKTFDAVFGVIEDAKPRVH